MGGTSYQWLDETQSAVNENIIDILIKVSRPLELPDELNSRIADTILKYDPINEYGLKLKIHALKNLDRITIAKSVYEQYAANYLDFYNKKYSAAFEQLLKNNL